MTTIKILDEHIANQIAAGEVIERPLSVVKELVENSIDANASRIIVSITQGGLEQIQVIDNGIGMNSDDMLLSFERHATSKIVSTKNLFKIGTLGFRGEALPSIAAISKVDIKSKREQDKLGTYILIEGGRQIKFEPIGCQNGTAITVKDIFFNTPARLKYLKSISTEANRINDYLTKIAIAHPNISFNYKHNNKQIFFTSGNNSLKDVIVTIYGNQSYNYWMPINAENLDFKISGYIAKPEYNRASRQYIAFFINGRYIRNYKLTDALLKAYHTLLPINKYPIAKININMDYSLVDVNVHPAKLEVRFSKESELYDFLLNTVQQTLNQSNLITKVIPKNNDILPNKNNINKHNSLITYNSDTVNNNLIMKIHEQLSDSNVIKQQSHNTKQITYTDYQANHNENEKNEHILNVRVIGQIHGTYIIAENDQGMLLIDQHAAHERINYEKVLHKIHNSKIKKQSMLIPLQLRYTATEIDILIEKKHILSSMAIDIDVFGENDVIVRTHPDWIDIDKIHEYSTYIIDNILNNNEVINPIDILEDKIIQFSCKNSIKGNMRLSQEEMEALIKNLNKTNSPYTCPHGRPVIIQYTSYELEKLFKRIT